MHENRKRHDRLVFFCLFLLLLWVGIFRSSRDLQGVIWSDTEGYYMYLPALFVQHSMHHVPYRSMDYRTNSNGEIVIKYTCGTAWFFLPFFLAAHGYAHVFHYSASGFSPPYYYAIIVCGAFWSVIGLYILRILLLRYFSYRVTWLTLMCILLGTNFFHYATKQPGMSHIYSFLLAAAILLLADGYYKRPALRPMLLLALITGWSVLIRPTNCVIIIPMLLVNISSWQDMKGRFHLLAQRGRDIAAAVPLFLLPMIPQLLYWKDVTGRWIVYSYQGESFIYWNKPKVMAVLFDPQNGWLLYSPVMLLAIPALMYRKRDVRANNVSVIATFAVITYLFASWWCWSFAQAFGHRCYIEFLPLFAFPLAVTIRRGLAIKRLNLKAAFILFLAGLTYYGAAMSILHDYESVVTQWDWREWAHLVKRIIVLQ